MPTSRLLNGRRRASERRSLHVPRRYQPKRGLARASPATLTGCLSCNRLWLPRTGARWLSHSWQPGWLPGSCPAARATPSSTSVRAGSATIMTDHAEGPGRDTAGWLVARAHQREPPSVPTSGPAGHRDHCRQAARRPNAGHLGQHHEAGRVERGVTRPVRYTIVIEESPRNYAANVPDLPGCVATGASEAETVREIHEAIRFHIESLREHHEPVPEPRCTATVVDVVALAG